MPRDVYDDQERIKMLIIRFIPMIISITMVTVAIYTLSIILREKILPTERKVTTQEKLFQFLEKGLNSGQFDESFCKTAFNHFDRQADGSLSKYGYVEILEDFVVYISSKSDTIIPKYYDDAQNILQKAKETEPFASLPSEEKRLMDSIKLFIQRKDTLNAANQLDELKQVILARHREYERIEIQNSWSIPLAIMGLMLTLIFGVWRIAKTIRKERKIS